MAENNNRYEVDIAHNHAQKSKKKWTVMVYLAGDNNLTANCISVLQQLEAVKYKDARFKDSLCVLACFDSNTPWPKGSRYLKINCGDPSKTGVNWQIHNDLIPPEERNHRFKPPSFCDETAPFNGEPQRRAEVAEGLRRFVNWAMKETDSEKYMLILYGHGPVVAGQSFLARDNPPSSLLLGDLKKILSAHFNPKRKLDILACQNCVMNGIETAYEVRDQVEYMIGSQGLVLASGWPYEKILGEILKDPDAKPKEIANILMKACARNLLDFAVMDRSSEQSVCNVDRIQTGRIPESGQNIITAVRHLVSALRRGLAFEDNKEIKERSLRFPEVVDAIKLARLEAQSYWGEVFADLYDFCERLLKKCNEAVKLQGKLLKRMGYDGDASTRFKTTELMMIFRAIIDGCIQVMNEVEGTRDHCGKVKTHGIVEESYFIGPELQYSHGVSIFFPWTLPTEPYFFTRAGNNEWVLRTAFETYCEYDFAQQSEWSLFLGAFFKATLRKVRRSSRDFALRENGRLDDGLVHETVHAPSEVLANDLQKSSSDTGKVDHDVWSTVKNYPRRNYLSPSDCARKIDTAYRCVYGDAKYKQKNEPPVSYLGWNISGIVAEVITAGMPASPATNGGRPGEVTTAAVPGSHAPGQVAQVTSATVPDTAPRESGAPGESSEPERYRAPGESSGPGHYSAPDSHKPTPGPGV
jgi:hypothetical protein